MKRSFLALLLTLLMLASLSLASCGTPAGPGDDTADTTAAPADDPNGPSTIISVTSKNYSLSNAEITYFFNSIYQNDVSYYGSYLAQMGLDTSKSLKEQVYGDGSQGTWFDLYMQQTKGSIETYVLFAEYAKSEGLELEEDAKTSIDSYISDAADYAAQSNMGLDEFLEYYFGKGVKESVLRKCLELQELATRGYGVYIDSLTFDDQQYEDAYNENPAQYQYVDLLSYTFTAPTLPEDAGEDEIAAQLASLKEEADKLAAAKTPDEFRAVLRAYLESKRGDGPESEVDDAIDSCLSKYLAASMLASYGFPEGLTAVGSTTITEGNNSYMVTMIASDPARIDSPTANIRHILFMPSSYEDSIEKAREEAEKTLQAFLDGEQTPENFAKLAEEKSEDPGSNTNGGLYEDISVLDTSLSATWHAWAIDSSRKAGDTGIVETSSGVHVMYYDSCGDPEWKCAVEAELENQACEELVERMRTEANYKADDEKLNQLDM